MTGSTISMAATVASLFIVALPSTDPAAAFEAIAVAIVPEDTAAKSADVTESVDKFEAEAAGITISNVITTPVRSRRPDCDVACTFCT